jgi:NAD(P)-dependent dehydrogenase (short-subunit alcohol dehydrogenase family)
MSELHVVLGATGGAGRAIVEALAGAGHETRAVNRAGDAAVPNRVAAQAADVSTDAGARAAVQGGSRRVPRRPTPLTTGGPGSSLPCSSGSSRPRPPKERSW